MRNKWLVMACCLCSIIHMSPGFVGPHINNPRSMCIGDGSFGHALRSTVTRLTVLETPIGEDAQEGEALLDGANGRLVADEWTGFREEDHDIFLKDYWQKRPLLIRNAVSGLSGMISPDELAGLACADDVESRIVQGGKEDAKDGDWKVALGPFDEQVFAELGESHWTLLVNEVNRHIPEVSDLLQQFAFVPNWRVDDVMVSYATEGGSVGPHVDNYDVFLVQGSGSRRWCIENRHTNGREEEDRSLPDIDLRVLQDFKEDQAWVLQPGDALYLPPRIAHHGVSLDKDCMTYSVGFRAPSTRDLLTFFGNHVATTMVDADADTFYRDPDLKKQDNPGLIERVSVNRAKEMLRKALTAALDDNQAFDIWFGAQVTSSVRDHTGYPIAMDPGDLAVGYQTPQDCINAIKRAKTDGPSGPFVYRTEGLTFAYINHGDISNPKGATLFVDGNEFQMDNSIAFLAPILCSKPRFAPSDLQPALRLPNSQGAEDLLEDLLMEGYLYPADD